MARSNKFIDYLTASIIFLMGAGAVMLGMNGYRDIQHLQKEGLGAEGTIIDNIPATDYTGGPKNGPRRTRVTYTPVVQYTDETGHHRQGKSVMTSVNYRNLSKGDKVTIHYSPEAPERILLSESSAKGAPVFFMIVGSFLCLVGGYVIHSTIKTSKRQNAEK